MLRKTPSDSWKQDPEVTCGLLSDLGQDVGCYFLIGPAERTFKSAPDLAAPNTEGAGLPLFSEREKDNSQYSDSHLEDGDVTMFHH